MTDLEAPENVRIVIDGTEFPCDVLRDPDQDREGCAAWLMVPRQPLPRYARSMSVRAAMLPSMSLLVFTRGEQR